MSETIPNLKKQVASKRIFQFLSKHPTEDKAKTFFFKAKQSKLKVLTTIYEDVTLNEPEDQIPDSPGIQKENQSSSQNSPFNSSFHAKYSLPKDRGYSPTPVLSRSGSLSPRSIMQSRRNEDSNYKIRFRLPMTGTQACLLYSDYLTEVEKKEIVKYELVYFFGNKIEKLSKDFEDENGVYKVVIGDHLAFRYEVIELLGKGTFGHVYKCLDYKRDIYVAVKILRKNSKIRRQGENEIKNLEEINGEDLDDSKNLVRMLQCFEFRSHLCISFELLSLNLYQFLRKNNFKGMNLNLIKRIALQTLVALRHLHNLGLTHSDLKLENILLKNEGKSGIKVIDLGSAIRYSNPLCSYLQSRYYRAPEVILGAGYDNKIDIWSFGCILVELFTGRSLFTGENEHDQLIRIMSVIGLPPDSVLEKARRRSCFFYDDFKPKLVKNKRGQILEPASKELFEGSEKDEILFKDFVMLCLQWDPVKRITAEEALKHPWIKGGGAARNLERESRRFSFHF
jgi:dual specificity tyrosine-phosphorylation-regulated kinase 2/3/4